MFPSETADRDRVSVGTACIVIPAAMPYFPANLYFFRRPLLFPTYPACILIPAIKSDLPCLNSCARVKNGLNMVGILVMLGLIKAGLRKRPGGLKVRGVEMCFIISPTKFQQTHLLNKVRRSK